MLHKKFKIHGCSGLRECHLNGLKCWGRRKLWTERRTDRRAENRTLISHLAKAGATKLAFCKHWLQSLGIHTGIEGIVSPI